MDTDDIYRLLEARRKKLDLSQAEVGLRAFGKLDAAPLQNIRRGSSPSADRLAALAQALDLEFYFGPKERTRSVTGFAEAAANLTTAAIDGSPEALRMGYLPLPYNDRQERRAGMSPVAIARTWLADRGLDPETLSWIAESSSFMQPEIPLGALCLVQKTTAAPEPPELTAAWMKGRMIVGHASRPSGNDWLFHFAAPDAAPYYIAPRDAAMVVLLGKVVAIFTEPHDPRKDWK